MAELIEIRDLTLLAVGAVGPPGERTFMIQAGSSESQLVVVVEKEQVAMLAAEAGQFLDQIARDHPEGHGLVDPADSFLRAPSESLFRARMIGLGYDPDADRVLVELREEAPEDDEESENDEDAEGWVARIYATRAQLRSMIATAADSVLSGRSRWN